MPLSTTFPKYKTQIGVGGLVLSDYEKKLVKTVLDSGRLTYGPMTRRFEEELARRHGCRYGLFVNSGTDALRLSLYALKLRHGWDDGDEVLVPSVTFIATSNVVIQNNMKPVFVDIEPQTFNMDPTKIEDKITKKTRAIIPVHLLGLPAAMGPICEIAQRHRLSIIEDSCETMFSTYNGQPVGSLGEIGCFSTYVAHFLVTGVGGMVVTNDADLAKNIRSLMNHGRDPIYISCTDDQGLDEQRLHDVVARRFSFIHVGYSSRCSEMEAALGLGQLARADEIVRRRQEIAGRLTESLSRFSDRLQLPVCPSDRTHTYMLYGLVLRAEPKDELINFLENSNIETRDLLPLVNQPIYRKLFGEHLEDQFPIAKWLNGSGFYIGCHPYMTDDEIDFIIRAFEHYFKTH